MNELLRRGALVWMLRWLFVGLPVLVFLVVLRIVYQFGFRHGLESHQIGQAIRDLISPARRAGG